MALDPETPDWDDQHRVATDDDVVADLHQIVDLRALADDRVAVGAAVDRYAGANLDIVLNDDAADLGHFEMPPRPEGEPEAVLSNMCAGMNDHAIADQRGRDRGRGADGAVTTDADLRTDDRIGADDRAGAELSARADHRARVHDDPQFEPRRRVNERHGGNPRLAKNGARLDRGNVKFGHHQGHRAVRLGSDENGASRGRCAGITRRNKRRLCSCSFEQVEISGIVEEGQIAWACLIESGHIPNYTAGVSIGGEGRAAPARDFGQ